MTRLLFAAARGAKIQYQNSSGMWCDSRHALPRIGPDDRYPWRIKPEDNNLQYGPTSTALRGLAECAPDAINGYSPEYWYAQNYKIDSDSPYYMQDELHRALYLLILAEALADKGL